MKNDPHYTIFAKNFGKGISHPVRYTILNFLAKNSMTVGEIIKVTGAGQSAVSQHLLVLKNGQLITSEKRGQFVFYSLNFDYMIAGLKGLTKGLENKAPR